MSDKFGEPQSSVGREVAEQRLVSIEDIWLTVRHRWKVFVGAIIATTLLAVVYSFFVEPVYRAEVIFEVTTPNQSVQSSGLAEGFGDALGLSALGLGQNSERFVALAMLETRGSIHQFIAEKNLLPILFSDAWDSKKGAWNDPADAPNAWDGYEKFYKDVLYVEDDADTGIVSLSIQWKNRDVAAQWAKEYLRLLDEGLRHKALSRANQRIDFLRKELANANLSELRNSISNLIQSELNIMMATNSDKEFTFKVIDEALVPDEDSYVWPNRPLIAILGVVLGLFSGFLIVMFSEAMGRVREEA